MPRHNKAKTVGRDMFAGLTSEESWILRQKIGCAAAMAGQGTRDYDLSAEAHEISGDLHRAWTLYLKGRKP
jgi:hypothetical protein